MRTACWTPVQFTPRHHRVGHSPGAMEQIISNISLYTADQSKISHFYETNTYNPEGRVHDLCLC